MKSESQHKKHPGGRKPKFDYRGEEFLSQVETYAKKGFTDREIAFALGLNPTYFYEMKSKYSEITDVLARGRATITAAVRAKFLAVAFGCIITMMNGGMLNAVRTKMQIFQRILTTEFLLTHGLKTN